MATAGAGQPPALNCKTLLRREHQVDMKSQIQVAVSFFLPDKTATVRIHCPLLGESLSWNAVNCEQRWEMMCFGLPQLTLLRKQALLWPTSLYKPAFMQLWRQCRGGVPKANEKMLQRMRCCCASTKAKGCNIVKCVGVLVSTLMFWRRKRRHSALQLSIGKMIDFLLKLFWYQVVVTWESLIHKLWVGNRGGEETCFSPVERRLLQFSFVLD